MTTSGLAELVRDRMGDLSPAERRVGRVLLASYPSAGLETTARLAERAHVSSPTVVRFASRLGFGGFVDLQDALRLELDERERSPVMRVAERRAAGATDDDGVASFGDAVTAALRRTLAALPGGEVDATVALLADGRSRLTVAGGRFSRLVGHYLALHLAQLRDGVRVLPEPPVEVAAMLHDIGRRDVLVLFDFRRYEVRSARLAQRAVDRDARLVLITDQWLSPISAQADHVLPVTAEVGSPYDTLVPAMAVVELLVDLVVRRLGDAAAERLAGFERTSRELDLI